MSLTVVDLALAKVVSEISQGLDLGTVVGLEQMVARSRELITRLELLAEETELDLDDKQGRYR